MCPSFGIPIVSSQGEILQGKKKYIDIHILRQKGEGMTVYTEMWKSLGLDIKRHDQLLNALGMIYSDACISQKEHPKGMGYFDFVISEAHGLWIKELLDS